MVKRVVEVNRDRVRIFLKPGQENRVTEPTNVSS